MPPKTATLMPFVHLHRACRESLDDRTIRGVVPKGVSLQPTRQMVIGDRLDRVEDLDWRAAQREQALLADRLRSDLHTTGGPHRIAYFGATWIPLALDLGYRTRGWLPIDVFQQHHEDKRWDWRERGPEEAGPRWSVAGLPSASDERGGDIILRISVSYRVAPAPTESVVPSALASIDLCLDPIAVDPFASLLELERAIGELQGVLGQLRSLLPMARAVHLFVAGPVGFCLRLGSAFNPTLFPVVYAYQYSAGGRSSYRRAFRIGRTLGELDARAQLLLLMSEPGPRVLRLDVEHRQIKRYIEGSPLRERFQVELEQAVQAHELQSLLMEGDVRILHWSGHGTPDGAVVVEGLSGRVEGGAPRELPLPVVVELLRQRRHRGSLRLLVLNLCHSALLARAVTVSGIVPCAIGMSDQISDTGAILFAERFYAAIGEGRSVAEAFDSGRLQVAIVGTHRKDERVVELFTAPGVHADQLYPLEES